MILFVTGIALIVGYNGGYEGITGVYVGFHTNDSRILSIFLSKIVFARCNSDSRELMLNISRDESVCIVPR